ncbi:Aste57867_24557 [Aphanomyces stellatus]|uniref:Aste57867_24557 protein n=1 Tax=Aphanomyces stellatus TaxID=120398 RepID=A0A485LQX7_9STRA|nr:hypothetical protein As57867_024479 [Aphanomyces stellatus]VFU01196.1 Aste57867_24557 [Aphanomyces stellatus]
MLNRKRRQETLRRSKLERNASSGAVYSFGANTHGVLGHEFHALDKPLKEPKLNLFFKNADIRVVAVASSLVHAGAVTAAGAMYTWGACVPGAFGTVDSPTHQVVRACPRRVDDLTGVQVVGLALGARHSVALTEEGSVYTWGAGEFGQLGHGDVVDNELFRQQFDVHTSRTYPTVDLPLRLDKSLFDGIQIKQVACGYYFTVVLAQDGCVYAWGEGSDGQLGLGLADDFAVGFLDDYVLNSNFTYMHTPQYVHMDQPMGAIGVGGNHVYAIGRNHRCVYEWGAAFRRDGDSLYAPTLHPNLSALYVKSISVGKDYAVAITGTVYLKLPGYDTMYALAAKFGTQPVDLYTGLSAPLIAAGVPKDKQAYAVKEEWTQKVVYVDRGKPTGVWLTVVGDDEVFTLPCAPSLFGPSFEGTVTYSGLCFFTPQKLSSLKYYVRPEEIQVCRMFVASSYVTKGKLVVLHVEESDLPVHDIADDVATVVTRLVGTMVEKVKDAQVCGAAAVVIVFSFVADAFSLTVDDDDPYNFAIPSVMLNAASGDRLLAYVGDQKRAQMPISMNIYHHDDTLGDQMLAMQKSGATAIVVGQNNIDKSPKRLTDSIFQGLGNPTAHANQIHIPVLMVSNETGELIKANYKQLIQDAFIEIGIASFGDVYAWGAGDHGVLGLGDVDNDTIFAAGYDAGTNTTYPLAKSPEFVDGLVQTKIVAVACGDQHSAAVSDTGDLYTWGSGKHGKLGHGSDQDESIPRLVEALHSVKVVDVACGPHYTLAVTGFADTNPLAD